MGQVNTIHSHSILICAGPFYRRVDYASTESLHMTHQAPQAQQPTLDEGSEVSLDATFNVFG